VLDGHSELANWGCSGVGLTFVPIGVLPLIRQTLGLVCHGKGSGVLACPSAALKVVCNCAAVRTGRLVGVL
jgi:hypothetical protein